MAAKKSKKIKRLVLKIKSLEKAKPAKPKRTAKPVKVLVKKVKPKKPNLVKPIEPPVYKTKIKVIGIGGGGSSIVSEIAPKVKKVDFVVANTDLQTLKETAREAKHFQFGKSLTQGLGTGMNPELGEQAAENEKEKIKEILKGADFCILVSCLGGGTGSGSSPVFAKILKNLGILTLGIFTLPFEFEGKKRAQIAKDSLEKLKPNLNALIIIPNQKIFQIIDKNTPLKESLSTINEALAESLEGLITLIDSPGLIHVDFANLKTILSGRGKLAYLNTAEVKNSDQIEELTKKILFNPLFPYNVKGAKEVLFNIDGGLNLNMDQVNQIGKTISDSISPQVKVAFGITQSKKEGIKITLLVNGCKWEDYNPPTTLPQKRAQWEEGKEKPEEKQVLITKTQEKSKKKTEEKPPKLPKVQQPEITQVPIEEPEKVEIKVRKNGLEIKKSIEDEKKKMLAQERKWETPAFLRRKPGE